MVDVHNCSEYLFRHFAPDVEFSVGLMILRPREDSVWIPGYAGMTWGECFLKGSLCI